MSSPFLFGLSPLKPNFDAALRDVKARDPRYREAAALALAEPPDGRDEEAREALRTLLDDALGPIRAAAVRGLGAIGDTFDGPVLLSYGDDAHADVRASVLVGAATLAARLAERTEDELRANVNAAAKRAFDEDASPRVRAAAVDALMHISTAHLSTDHPGESLSLAARALEDEDQGVRLTAANALEDALPGAKAEQALREALNSSTATRRRAALALARHGKSDDPVEEVLIAALRDPTFRLAAIDGLRNGKSPRAANALAELGERRFVDLVSRAAAGEALATRGDERAIAILRAVLRAFRADGRDYALRAVAEHKLKALKPEVEALRSRRRGASKSAVDEAVRALAGS
ncbi:MAG: HEAT repeat domain-containing protein [Myxococcota bacterium]